MMNIQSLMKQANAMQKKMEEEQKKLESTEFEGTSGGGLVKVILNGKFDMKKIDIDTSLVNSDEIDILEDLIAAAYNDAKTKAEKAKEEGMQGLTGGLNLGGFKLPF